MQPRRYKSLSIIKNEAGELTAKFERITPYTSTCYAVGGGVHEVRLAKKYDEFNKSAMEAFNHLNRSRLNREDMHLVNQALLAFNPIGVKKDVPVTPKEGRLRRWCKAIKNKLSF